jgi:hypothetical protein
MPDSTFTFPPSGSRHLRFQHNWLQSFKWLVYSPSQDGAYCIYCKLFAPVAGIGPGHQPRGALSLTKFTKWTTAKQCFKEHECKDYHKNCVSFGDNLQTVHAGMQDAVDMQIDRQLKAEITENRKRLIPIVETIILCGQQNWPLRGKHDSGRLNPDENHAYNDGGFRALLRYRANGGDTSLQTHLRSCASNATYLSPQIQNEIIATCNSLILSKLVTRVNAARCFTVLADETTDVSGTEQFSLCVRYVDDTDSTCKIREDFLQFVPIFDVTGKGLAKVILDSLRSFGINTSHLRGQGYDGAAAMSGRFNGVQAFIKEQHPQAVYVHCSAHSLNLAVSDACSLQAVRNCMGTIGSVHGFLNTPKRLAVLKECIDLSMPDSNRTRLRQMCPTRWVERHDSVLVFIDLLKPVIHSLGKIAQWADRDSASGANQLLLSIKQPEFLLTVHVVAKLFAINLPLCRQLQSSDIDLAAAMQLANNVEEIFKDMRNNADTEFRQIYESVSKVCADLDVELVMPRLSVRQTKRCNVQADSAEDYFRIAIFIPFIDAFIVQLQERLSAHKSLLTSFMCLLPKFPVRSIGSDSVVDISTVRPSHKQVDEMTLLTDAYAVDLQCSQQGAICELELWYKKLAAMEQPPNNAIDAYLICNCDLFPVIKQLLKILATLPVSTCTSERSFSTLRRLKTYLRNTMCEERLNGLALLHVHRDLIVTPDEVLDKLALKNRRLHLT